MRPFAEHRPQIGADQLAGANGVIVLTPAVTRDTVAAADDLLAIGRFGVGYDSVDVAACTEADVLVFITVGAVDRPVAEATVGMDDRPHASHAREGRPRARGKVGRA